MERDTFYVIKKFMLKELKLKGNDLLVYAIIYGFSQDNESRYRGGLQYLADMTNSTKQGVLKNLDNLLNMGLIAKQEYSMNNIRLVEYYSTEFNTIQQSSNFDEEFNGIQHSLTALNLVNGGIKQSLPNNIIDSKKEEKENKENNIYIMKESKEKDNIDFDHFIDNTPSIKHSANDTSEVGVKHFCETSRFKKPTIEEIQEYCDERKNGIDAQRFYDFYEMKGWKVGKETMKDWKAGVRTWEQRNNNNVAHRDFEEREYTQEQMNSGFKSIMELTEDDL